MGYAGYVAGLEIVFGQDGAPTQTARFVAMSRCLRSRHDACHRKLVSPTVLSQLPACPLLSDTGVNASTSLIVLPEDDLRHNPPHKNSWEKILTQIVNF